MAIPKIQNGKKIRYTVLAGAAAVVLLGGGLFLLTSRGQSDQAQAIFPVQRGPLTISIFQAGTIKAKNQVIIKNEVEGRTSIIYLIEEGARVRKGDLLVELDASSMLDLKIDREISVQNAEAAYINSKENLAVVENQAESDKDIAQLTLDFAQEDLKKYQEGEYPSQMKDSEAKIKLAEEEMERAHDTLEWSRKLWEEKYISENEYKADEHAVAHGEYHRAFPRLPDPLDPARAVVLRNEGKERHAHGHGDHEGEHLDPDGHADGCDRRVAVG